MKKLIALSLALMMMFALAACGGPDKQPAIDAYNKLAANYNTFVAQENENLDAWAEEDIEYMNEIAAVITEYSEKLSGDTEFTQEQIDELKAHVDEINYDVAAAYEKEVRHDVMAHVKAYGELIANAATVDNAEVCFSVFKISVKIIKHCVFSSLF